MLKLVYWQKKPGPEFFRFKLKLNKECIKIRDNSPKKAKLKSALFSVGILYGRLRAKYLKHKDINRN